MPQLVTKATTSERNMLQQISAFMHNLALARVFWKIHQTSHQKCMSCIPVNFGLMDTQAH